MEFFVVNIFLFSPNWPFVRLAVPFVLSFLLKSLYIRRSASVGGWFERSARTETAVIVCVSPDPDSRR